MENDATLFEKIKLKRWHKIVEVSVKDAHSKKWRGVIIKLFSKRKVKVREKLLRGSFMRMLRDEYPQVSFGDTNETIEIIF